LFAGDLAVPDQVTAATTGEKEKGTLSRSTVNNMPGKGEEKS
jgi:hypothetical protein